MTSQFAILRTSFEYLTLQEEETILNLLEQVHYSKGHYPTGHFEYLQQCLKLLAEWRLPARAILTMLRATLKEAKTSHPATRQEGDDDPAVNGLLNLCPPSPPCLDARCTKASRIERRRQLFKAAHMDLELALVSLAMHCVRMDAIDKLDRAEAQHLAQDNQEIFLPLAEMMGAWELRRRLGDLGLRHLDQGKLYSRIDSRRENLEKAHQAIYQEIRAELEVNLRRDGIHGEIVYRPNSPSSIYRRMLRGEDLEENARRCKVDVIVNDERECYRVLQFVHNHWVPLAGHPLSGGYFRDQIASPRYNGYRSLVTTVNYLDSHALRDKGKETRWHIEFRIYTHQMKQINDKGVIQAKFIQPQPAKGAWWEEMVIDFHHEYAEDRDTNPIYVFSPLGQIYRLADDDSSPMKQDSALEKEKRTPKGYAEQVHSRLQKRLGHVLYLVNGIEAPANQLLHNADVVEVVSAYRPRKEDVDRGRRALKSVFDHEKEAYAGMPLKWEDLEQYIKDRLNNKPLLQVPDLDTLYERIACNDKRFSPNRIFAGWITSMLAGHIVKPNGAPIGIPAWHIRFSQCEQHGGQKIQCRVSPHCAVVGKILNPGTPHERLVVYRRDCPNAPQGEHVIALEWRGNLRHGEAVRLTIGATDRPKLLGTVLEAVYRCYDEGLYLWETNGQVANDQLASIRLTVEARRPQALAHLRQEMDSLRCQGMIGQVSYEHLSPLDKHYLADPDNVPNLYTPSPIKDARLFKGRENEIGAIIHCLLGPRNPVVLYGLQRIGKTSLLYHLRDYKSQDYRLIPAHINFPTLSHTSDAAFWESLAHKIHHQLDGAMRGKVTWKTFSARHKDYAFSDFKSWLEMVCTSLNGRYLLLLMDELNTLDERWEPSMACRISDQIKDLIEDNLPLAFVISVQESLYHEIFSGENENRLIASRQVLRRGTPIHLTHLSREAAERLVREPLGEQLDYSNEAVERILSLTDCHPYYLQRLLYQIVLLAKKQGPAKIQVNLNDIDQAQQALLANGNTLFSHNFDELYYRNRRISDCTQALLKAIAQASRRNGSAVLEQIRAALGRTSQPDLKRHLESTLQCLCELGIVRRDNQHYTIRVPMFDAWLCQD